MHKQKKEIARANLSLEDVSGFVVAFPSKDEQEEIASILSRVEMRLDVAEGTMSTYQNLFSSLLHMLMTSQVRVTAQMIEEAAHVS